MKTLIKISLYSFLFSLFVFPVFPQSGRAAAFPRLEPDPRALEFHQMGATRGAQSYTWTELAEISLWSSDSNASANSIDTHLRQIQRMIQAIQSSPDLPGDNRGRAEFVLEYMHRNLLRSYSFTQTRVDTMLTNGRYNCVSSAVLYVILCRSLGIETSGVMTRDHAFAIVHLNGEDIDVETTNRHGFDPGRRREFQDEFGRTTGFSYVPPGNYRDRQTISNIELVSLILRNRIAELEGRNRFAEAVPLAVDRTALLLGQASHTHGDGGTCSPEFFEDPYSNLLDRILNFGNSLLMARQEEEALNWAALASARYPDENRWLAFFRVATDVILANGTNRIRSVQEGENILAAIEEARSNEQISETRANEFSTSAIQRTASIIAAPPGRDWLAAISFIEEKIVHFGSNRELERTLSDYRSNRATDFHNRFATAWNRRNYDEAERILNEGLTEFPNDRRLLANRETVNRQRQ